MGLVPEALSRVAASGGNVDSAFRPRAVATRLMLRPALFSCVPSLDLFDPRSRVLDATLLARRRAATRQAGADDRHLVAPSFD